jgi:flagellar basal-body rod modification protein FlgD
MIPSSTPVTGSLPGLDPRNLTARASEATTKKPSDVDPNDLANKEVFLQLLIAQIKNQDPSKPADSIQYITQLSQFTGVEQLVDIKNQLKTLTAKLTPAPAADGEGN